MISRSALILTMIIALPAICLAGWTDYGPFLELWFGIDFVNSNDGWVAGGANGIGPRINYSSNGGQTWVNQTSEMETMMWMDIDMANEDVGYACGMAAFIIYGSGAKTTNGGRDWNIVFNQSPIAAFSDVQTLDESTVIQYGLWTQWLQEKYGAVISDDGGETWSKCHWGITDRWALWGWFVDREHGWISGGTYPVEEEKNSPMNYLHPYFRTGDETQKIEPFRATIRRTDDGGETFTTVFEEDGFSCNHVQFINRNEGWVACFWDDAVNYKSKIFHTKDAGDTWEEQDIPCDEYATMSDIHFFNRREGYAVGFRTGFLTIKSVVIHTTDGGKTWVEDPWSTNIGPLHMTWLNEAEGWFTGANDLQYSRIARFYDETRVAKVSLAHLSPPTTASPGETIQWNIKGKNLTGDTLNGDVWLSITSPELPESAYPFLIPLYNDVTLPGEAQGQAPVVLSLPSSTPSGVYNIEVLFGPYGSENPYEIIAYDQFDLEVQ